MTDLIKVMTRATKRFGQVYPASETEYAVRITGKGAATKITVFRKDKAGEYQEHRTFGIGDVAEHDSYNLRYCGIITAISEKSVSISHSTRSAEGKQHRLDLNKFCWRNYNFNWEKTCQENHVTSMSL